MVFDRLPEFDWHLNLQMEERIRSQVDDEVTAQVDEWIASWSNEERQEKHENYLAVLAHVGDIGDEAHGTQYPLYKLVEAYKKLMALP